jgi:Flp pilus assembly pilin Flp
MSLATKKNRGFWREQGGAALVEFTLVLPLLLLFAAGVTELGYAMHQQHVAQKAVRDAARYAARYPFALKSCPLATQPEWAAMVTDTAFVALHGKLNTGSSLLMPNWSGARAADVVVSETCFPAGTLISPAGGGNDIPVIKVSASVQFTGVGFLSVMGLSGFDIKAEHSEMWAGL